MPPATVLNVLLQNNVDPAAEATAESRVAGIENDTAENIYSLVSRSVDDEFTESFFKDPVR